MRLTITPQKGEATTWVMSCDGRIISQIVIDPKTPAGMMECKAWVDSQGGTAPLKDADAT